MSLMYSIYPYTETVPQDSMTTTTVSYPWIVPVTSPTATTVSMDEVAKLLLKLRWDLRHVCSGETEFEDFVRNHAPEIADATFGKLEDEEEEEKTNEE